MVLGAGWVGTVSADTPAAKRLRDTRDRLGPDHPESKAAFAARWAETMEEELDAGQYGLYVLSFVDTEISATIPMDEQRPGGPSYLGGVVVEAIGPAAAVGVSHALGINPGGQVAIFGPLPLGSIGSDWMGRLLTADEVRAIPEPEGWGE